MLIFVYLLIILISFYLIQLINRSLEVILRKLILRINSIAQSLQIIEDLAERLVAMECSLDQLQVRMNLTYIRVEDSTERSFRFSREEVVKPRLGGIKDRSLPLRKNQKIRNFWNKSHTKGLRIQQRSLATKNT